MQVSFLLRRWLVVDTHTKFVRDIAVHDGERRLFSSILANYHKLGPAMDYGVLVAETDAAGTEMGSITFVIRKHLPLGCYSISCGGKLP